MASEQVENIRKDIRALVAKYDGHVNFADWDKKDDSGAFTMIRAVTTFKVQH